MEEKERYEWNSRFDEAIKDNQTGDIVNAVEVLNQQDKRIKELEEENQQLKQQLEEKDKDIKYFKESYYMIQDEKDHYAGQCLNLQDRIEELEKNNKRIRKNWENSKTQQTRLYNNLKQQLHDLPKKIVEEIKNEVDKEKSNNDLAWLGFRKLNRILDTILKKYGEKDE